MSSFVRVLGSADWHVTKGNDQSYYTLNDTVLVDCGGAALFNMLGQDIDPMKIDTVLFTHMHADHYMGLGPLVHLWRVNGRDLSELTLIGPKAQLREAVELCIRYAFWDSPDYLASVIDKPKLVELTGGERFEVKGLHVDTIASDHAVPGVCYRVTDAEGGSVGFTGDTRYRAEYADFFRGVDVLFHECSMGEGPLPARNEQCRHSSAIEAAQVCRESGARKLALIHCYEGTRDLALAKAKSLTDTPVVWAQPYTVFSF